MTRRPPLPLLVLALLAPLFALLNAAVASPAEACGPGVEGHVVDGMVLCTHGNDEAPPGVDTTELPSTEELLEARFGVDTKAEVQEVVEDGAADDPTVAGADTVACVGDGISGARVQLVYAHASNVANRYSSVLPLLRQYAADADDMINVSAGKVGDGRRIRYVTNASCLPEVLNITLSSTGDDNFGNTVTELRNMGLTSNDRKYLAFVDAAVGICGLGEVYLNDRGDELNPNNSGRPQYARVDTGCWQHAAAHELIHTLGGVQNTAPNSSGAGHCTDEVDVMCYKDTSTTVIRQVWDTEQVDCNNNDYFHPNPQANSYLATKWNVARSRYLSADSAPPPPPVTTVTVPTTGYAGSPWSVNASVATAGAGIVWSSTRADCWFGDPHAAATTWNCPATAQGDGQVTVHVTEDGIMKAYTTPVTLVVPATKLTPSVSLRASATSITSGQSVTLSGRVLSMATGAPVPGLPVWFQAKPRNTKTWSDVASAVTNRTGHVSATVTPQKNTSYRMVTNFNRTWAMAYTSPVEISVSTKLTTSLNSKVVAPYSTTSVGRQTVKLTTQVSPDKGGDIIKLKRYTKGKWRLIREVSLNANSAYTFFYTPQTSGKHHLKVVKPGDATNRVSRRFITLNVG